MGGSNAGGSIYLVSNSFSDSGESWVEAVLTAREDLLSLNEFVRFGENGSPPLPVEFRLSPNYPNPFNAETNIRYTLPEEAHVTLQIFNIKGQLVRTLVNEIERQALRTSAGWAKTAAALM
ncbi:T9SS type A sorting domain-containing protein [candidate division KSB1 bacterium]|nr:T9SS type A sorting domain-containing protein [candidate division KSB1 bacterium]